MNWGDPEFVLGIIAILSMAGVIKAGIRAKHGLPMDDRPRGRRAGKRGQEEIETLRAANARLTERVEAYEDRVVVLERIVTDGGYHLAHEIERLRDEPARNEGKGKVQ